MYEFTLHAKNQQCFANSFIGAHSICTPLPSREQEKHTISLATSRGGLQDAHAGPQCLLELAMLSLYILHAIELDVRALVLWFTLCTWVVQCLQIDQEMFSEFRSFGDSVIGWENCVTGDASKI